MFNSDSTSDGEHNSLKYAYGKDDMSVSSVNGSDLYSALNSNLYYELSDSEGSEISLFRCFTFHHFTKFHHLYSFLKFLQHISSRIDI